VGWRVQGEMKEEGRNKRKGVRGDMRGAQIVQRIIISAEKINNK
jgi:ribosomal protein S6E (S10)